MKVLVVGATGSVGRLVVQEVLDRGHAARALVRSEAKGRTLPDEAETVVGDVTRPGTLIAAVQGVDAVVLTLGADGAGRAGARDVSYGGVRNVLAALGEHPARIVLMTAIGVTNREGDYNRQTGAHDWKRRSERLVRASGRPYTIVRPGWFDDNDTDQHRLHLLQGDTRRAGNASDGVIARQQIAQVLVASLSEVGADYKTFELVAERGEAQADIGALFVALAPDITLDGVQDQDNMPISSEPQDVQKDLSAERKRGVQHVPPQEHTR